MSYLPNQYEDPVPPPQGQGLLKVSGEIDALRKRLHRIRDVFQRYETPSSFAGQREAYQELRKLILEEVM